MSELAVAEKALSLTESAAARVAALIKGEGNPALMLRVSVSGGGCSGFQYGFNLDEAKTNEDLTFEHHGVTVVVDDTSLDLLAGSTIDYVEELVGAAFRITNPQASSTCGCGSSFAV